MSGEVDANHAEARVAEAAAERRDARRSGGAGPAGASMRDVLVGMAECRDDVVIGVESGRTHRVRVVGVGSDVVVADTDSGTTLLLGIDTVTAIRATGRRTLERDRRADGTQSGRSMVDMLADRVAERPRITVRRGHDRVAGRLTGVGLDIATVTADAADETVYVRLDSMTEIVVSDSSSP